MASIDDGSILPWNLAKIADAGSPGINLGKKKFKVIDAHAARA
jgi:hypothetical protein